jgi:hypothetical protein
VLHVIPAATRPTRLPLPGGDGYIPCNCSTAWFFSPAVCHHACHLSFPPEGTDGGELWGYWPARPHLSSSSASTARGRRTPSPCASGRSTSRRSGGPCTSGTKALRCWRTCPRTRRSLRRWRRRRSPSSRTASARPTSCKRISPIRFVRFFLCTRELGGGKLTPQSPLSTDICAAKLLEFRVCCTSRQKSTREVQRLRAAGSPRQGSPALLAPSMVIVTWNSPRGRSGKSWAFRLDAFTLPTAFVLTC